MGNTLIDEGTLANYTVMNVATENLGIEAGGWCGKSVVTFDKVTDGAILFAGAYKILTDKTAIVVHGANPHTQKVCWELNVSATTNIASAFLRLGTDASNYNTWTVADTTLTVGGCTCKVVSGTCTRTGTGCDWSRIKYIAFGVTFDGSTNTLANMQVEKIEVIEATESNA